MNDLTPLMKQHREIKRLHPDAIVFFRVGDFYEMFSDDAVVASPILEIALTSRDKSKENAVPLCGVPYHAASGYIAKLIRAGKSVAICEQTEDPAQAKGLVRREVVRVITPGTLVEPELLSAGENHYIAAAVMTAAGGGLAWADLSTGEFNLSQYNGPTAEKELVSELARLEPREILAGDALAPRLEAELPSRGGDLRIGRLDEASAHPDLARSVLLDHFRVQSLAGFECDDLTAGIAAAGALLRYLRDTQRSSLGHLTRIRRIHREAHLVLDAPAQRNLELTRRLSDGRPEGSLVWVLDATRTPMGARLIRNWVVKPLMDLEAIRERQDAVERLLAASDRRTRLTSRLSGIGDLERISGRVALGSANARDLIQLRNSLARLPELPKIFLETAPLESGPVPPLLEGLGRDWDDLSDLRARISETLVDDPPPGITEGGLIRDGVDAGLDELRKISREGKNWISDLEARERRRTGIETLKVRYNQVFGYYIEVSKTRLAKVPADFHRKQTLVNAERFVTPELKELESKVLGADEKIRKLEQELFSRLREETAAAIGRLQAVSRAVALLDVLAALAETAARGNYVRPVVHEGFDLEIRDGRHPMLERMLPRSERFVPNDTRLDREGRRLLIITGPNMAGKSTYMRQVALITIMAQMGGFVPAAEARIGLVDRIFTRVGSSDDLMGGRSTFMVEMTETAVILHQASARSLIILDEVGRGTSTFDGVSIAWAVAEYLHDPARVGARTLFATHYHQLTELASVCPAVKNYNIAVREWNDEIIFLRKIVEGGTDRSYGVQVARLAGLPAEVIARAKEILSHLDRGGFNDFPEKTAIPDALPAGASPEPAQIRLFSNDPHSIIRTLRSLDIAHLTPMEAINCLHDLKKKADE